MRVLVIGDLHSPFTLKGYLRHCKKLKKQINPRKIVFIGDIIDSHYSSYHETDPDGMSAGDELKLAIKKLKPWYRTFPEAIVTIGNHDRIIARKAMSAGLSTKWLRDINEVLEVPGWRFTESTRIDNVRYCHGDGRKAIQRAVKDMESVVQGHYHSECYVQWHTGAHAKVFGMQIGNGIDKDSYAMAYGKHGPHPAIACGVVINGKIATNYLMDL